MFGLAQMEAVAPLAFRTQGEFAIIIITLMFAVNGLGVVLMQPRLRPTVERLGPISSLRTAGVIWAASYVIAFAAVTAGGPVGVALVMAFALFFAAGEVFIAPSMQPLVAATAPPDRLGVYAAAISMMYSMSMALGPAWGAPLTNLPPAIYWCTCALGISLLVLVLRNFEHEHADQ